MRIRAAIVVIISAFAFGSAPAQTQRPQDDTQSWNDLQIKLSLDVYYMRQNDCFSRTGDLHVIGTNWRVKL